MTDYKQMYLTLCHGISDALDLLQTEQDTEKVYQLLHDALNAAEDIYIDTTE
jgi:hypothetical protein